MTLDPHRIDVHHHVATESNPLYGLPDGLTWWSVDNALRVMDGTGIAVAMLSPQARLPSNPTLIRVMQRMRDGPSGRAKPIRELMRKAVRKSNEEVARTAQLHPDRFGFFANLALLNTEDALRETEYAFDTLGADGVFLPTNVGSIYLGEPVFEPLFAELNRRSAVIFVHPMHLPCPAVPGIPGHVADFLLSTVRAATNLVRTSTLRRYPSLTVILTHAGGFIPYAAQRLSMTLASSLPQTTSEALLAEYRKFYFDLAVSTAPDTVSALLKFADPTHVVYGSDFPFNQPDDVEFFARQLDAFEVDPVIRQAINHTNAETLFPRFRR
ncbi:MAG: 6-methylsalicylate decarboxylase [Mycobacterium sp.]|nr:6-methylsalicylate decarboxylase [Mycobacterium sp.]